MPNLMLMAVTGCGTVTFQMMSGALVIFPVLHSGWGKVVGKPCGLFNQGFCSYLVS